MPVSTLLANISSREITEWQAYSKIKKEREESEQKAEEQKYSSGTHTQTF